MKRRIFGVVTYAGVDTAYGGRVVIDHGMIGGRRLATTYSHLSALGVRVGQVVGAGAGIGLVGSTGYSTGCHLHVELLVNGSFVDPAPWFRNGTITQTVVTVATQVGQVENPTPEPEVPNETTTPLLPTATDQPSTSVPPSALDSTAPSVSASTLPSDSVVPSVSTDPSTSTQPSVSTDPSTSTQPSVSTDPSTSTQPSVSTQPSTGYCCNS